MKSSVKVLNLYYDWSSPPSRALITFCKYVKIPNIKMKEVRLTKNEHLTPEYTNINPIHQVPAILEYDELDTS
jgi:hypothetical protein